MVCVKVFFATDHSCQFFYELNKLIATNQPTRLFCFRPSFGLYNCILSIHNTWAVLEGGGKGAAALGPAPLPQADQHAPGRPLDGR